ncbi:hypothetical protein [Promicromonospora sp. NPDC019610]|uniref:hypothetical protein n=1 Tax=Promicromonospora sp. NPDC019610 TaxID=3364405 RepID=UPI003797F4A5
MSAMTAGTRRGRFSDAMLGKSLSVRTGEDGADGARLIFVYFASYALFTPKIDLNLLSNGT